jgi:small-conductance mechanosensitive channel
MVESSSRIARAALVPVAGTVAQGAWTLGVLAALVAVYFILRWLVRRRIADAEGQSTVARHLILLLGLIGLVAIAGIWLGESRNWAAVEAFVRDSLGLQAGTFRALLLTVVVIVGYLVVRGLLASLAGHRIQDVAKRYIATKTINYLLGLVVLIVLIRIWLGGVTGIVTYLGLVSAGLAIALQDPLTNLAGWLYLTVRKPFVVGDRVQIGEHAGDVIDVSLFQFTLVEIGEWVDADQSTGRLLHVPNGWLFKHATCNYTKGFNFIWNELPVTVTFESNWEKAREILTRVGAEFSAVKSEHAAQQIRRASQKYMIFFQHLSPIVWTSVAENGVTLTVRYLCLPRNRRGSADKMWEAILREFAAQDDIDFAYPTWRVFNNPLEGKRGTRPSGPAGQ